MKTVSIEEAQEIIVNAVSPLDWEDISLVEAANRVLYEDVVSDIMLPPADDSSMDGFAVIAADTRGASIEHPVRLQITGEVRAGGSAAGQPVSSGTAIKIMTGGQIPEGADAVVRLEDTEEEAGFVRISHETARYENYRFSGGCIKQGENVLGKGDRLNCVDVGILASLNYNTVKVYKQPTVSIISTGDELADINAEIKNGQIRNVNAYMLYSEVKRYNAVPDYLGITKDTLEDMRRIFLKALKSDVVVSTGGVSMGRYDFIKQVYSDLNIETKFESVNVKPGRPCAFGKKDDKLIFSLPGNPFSTLTSFAQFVRPALLKLMGAKRLKKPVVNAFLEEDIVKKPGHVHLVRGYFTLKNNEFYVSKTGNQNSCTFRSMSDANCLIIIPEDISRVKAGEKVAIELIDHGEL
ncbi:MAG: molybdopterin molybdotransferase MoeA [Peptococcaceae bacterium]|nr:molybdopterin molybdotransferase MoeA [Peptococcaceae bacterium]